MFPIDSWISQIFLWIGVVTCIIAGIALLCLAAAIVVGLPGTVIRFAERAIPAYKHYVNDARAYYEYRRSIKKLTERILVARQIHKIEQEALDNGGDLPDKKLKPDYEGQPDKPTPGLPPLEGYQSTRKP